MKPTKDLNAYAQGEYKFNRAQMTPDGYVKVPEYQSLTNAQGDFIHGSQGFQNQAQTMADDSSKWTALQQQKAQLGATQGMDQLGRQGVGAANAAALGQGGMRQGLQGMQGGLGGVQSQLGKGMVDASYGGAKRGMDTEMFNAKALDASQRGNLDAKLKDVAGYGAAQRSNYEELLKQQQGKEMAAAQAGIAPPGQGDIAKLFKNPLGAANMLYNPVGAFLGGAIPGNGDIKKVITNPVSAVTDFLGL